MAVQPHKFTGLFSCTTSTVDSIDSRATGTCGIRFALLESWSVFCYACGGLDCVGMGREERRCRVRVWKSCFVLTLFASLIF